MKFEFDNASYDTDEMIAIEGVRSYPWGVYITRDHRHVFGVYMVPMEGIHVHQVKGERLWAIIGERGDPHLRKACEMDGECAGKLA